MQPLIFRLEVLASIVFNNNHGRSLPTLSVCVKNNVHQFHDNYNVCIKATSSFMLCIGISTEASAPAVQHKLSIVQVECVCGGGV